MDRRNFLTRTGAAVSVGAITAASRTKGYGFLGSALAAGESDGRNGSLEQKFADFALSIKYEALPSEVVASVKRVFLDTLACAFGAVGSEPAEIGEKTSC